MIKLALVGFCAGLIIIEQLPVPYSLENFALVIVLLIPLIFNPLFFSWRGILFLFFIIGTVWALYQIEQQRRAFIPQEFMNVDRTMVVEITELPFQTGDALRLVGRIICNDSDKKHSHKNLSFKTHSSNNHCNHEGKRLLLKWFNPPHPAETVTGVWVFTVSLKPVRGLVNPNGFDYEKWLFQQKLSALGTVRAGQQLAGQELSSVARVQKMRAEFKSSLNHFLSEQADSIPTFSLQTKALLFALLLGDRSVMTPEMWQVLTATQTSHLVAISGLHMSLVVGIGLLVLSVFLRLLFPGQWRILFPRLALLALFPAAGYLLLAGFSLPTQRAFLMASILIFGGLIFQRVGLINSLLIAVAMLLVLQPLAPLSISFWLTCSAVFWIAFLTQGRLKSLSSFISKLSLQTKIYLAMVPISLMFFSGSSLLGVVANWIAIPMLSLLIMPVMLLWLGLYLLEPGYSVEAFKLLDTLLTWFWQQLDWFAGRELALVLEWPQQNLVWILLFTGLLFSPLSLRYKWIALPIFLLPILTPDVDRISAGEVNVVMFDVGQGTSVLIETAQHQLLYDTGNVFPSGFNMVDAAVLPYLKQKQKKLDMVVVSHSDKDHSGGLPALVAQWPIEFLLADPWLDLPEAGLAPIQQTAASGAKRVECLDGIQWEWDQIEFAVLNAGAGVIPHHASHSLDQSLIGDSNLLGNNNQSCLLIISVGDRQIVLAGDIEREAERLLLQRDLGLKSVDVLLVPHHGSQTSSSIGFLNRLQPAYGLISAGFNNRFQHPHESVVDRYLARGAQVFNTAEDGAVEIVLDETGVRSLESYRSAERAYFWRQFDPQDDTESVKEVTTSNNERKISKIVLNFLKNNVQGLIMSHL